MCYTTGSLDPFLLSFQSQVYFTEEVDTLFLIGNVLNVCFPVFLFSYHYQDVANSLDAQIRQNISSFVDAIEEILMQQTRAEIPV